MHLSLVLSHAVLHVQSGQPTRRAVLAAGCSLTVPQPVRAILDTRCAEEFPINGGYLSRCFDDARALRGTQRESGRARLPGLRGELGGHDLCDSPTGAAPIDKHRCGATCGALIQASQGQSSWAGLHFERLRMRRGGRGIGVVR